MINFDDNDIPFWLIIYAGLTVVVSVYAPENTPESVKISILVSGQTALGGAAGMSRTGNKNRIGRVDNIEHLDSQGEETTNYISSENNQPYK